MVFASSDVLRELLPNAMFRMFSAPFLTLVALLSLVISVQAQSLLERIIFALQSATDCDSCHISVLPPMQALAQLGDDAFVSTFIEICELLQVSPLLLPVIVL